AHVPDEVQLHIGDLGDDDRPARGPTTGRPDLHRIRGRAAARVLVRVRPGRRLHPLGGAGQRLDGRRGARHRRGRCPRLDRDDRAAVRGGDDRGAGPGAGRRLPVSGGGRHV
ncbi:MAG: hypothetical protein AVDCRST_MAG57-1690, partial [uncultured Blastococcus sp.]